MLITYIVYSNDIPSDITTSYTWGHIPSRSEETNIIDNLISQYFEIINTMHNTDDIRTIYLVKYFTPNGDDVETKVYTMQRCDINKRIRFCTSYGNQEYFCQSSETTSRSMFASCACEAMCLD